MGNEEEIDPIIKDLMALLPLSTMLGKLDNLSSLPLDDTKLENAEVYKGPDVLAVSPELPSDKPHVHEQKYENVNGPDYVRKVGNVKSSEIDGNNIMNSLFDEIGDFNMFNEETPQKLKNTDIPY